MRTTRTAYAALLLIVALLALCLHGCRSARPTDERPNASLVAPPVRLDSSVGILHTAQLRHNPMPQKAPSEKPGLIARIFHSGQAKQDRKNTSNPRAFINSTSVPKKCKGCQFTTVIGNDNQVSQASIGKNKAAAVVNSDSATQQVATNASAGRGNTATQTATETKPPGIGATIAAKLTGPLGWVLAIAAAGAVAYLLYLIWAFIPRRNANNQA